MADKKKTMTFRYLVTGIVTVLVAVCMALPVEAGVQRLSIGTSEFSLLVPADFVPGKVTDKERADDLVAYYKSDKTMLDFDLYQFTKEGQPKDLMVYAQKEAAEYKSTPESRVINGIEVAYYRAVETYEGKTYPTITYIFDNKKDFLEVVLWLDGDNAEDEAEAIICTLNRR